MLHRWAAAWRSFAAAREGVAAVEFALVMPLLLVLYLGSIETTQLISADQRVTNVAGTVGDLVARVKNEIDSGTLTDYFAAAQSIMQPFSTTTVSQVVSVVSVDSNGVTKVLWSQAYNGGTAQIKNQPFTSTHPIPGTMTDIAKGSYLVVSEATYPYPSMFGLFFNGTLTLYHQGFYMPRYASVICYNQAPPC